jgi:Tfp pilus assembly protein PilF
LTFLILLFATLTLYAVTSFLFRSFAARRAELARDFAASGQAALAQGHPDQAIASLREALSYAPDDHTSHLLLAEALAEAHHTREATNYFMSLRDSQPADGFINLELARLARQSGDSRQAIDDYRASSLGNWEGDSLALRLQVQLELSDYLVKTGDPTAARAELLAAAANAPETASSDILFADKLQQAGDAADALTFYQKTIKLDPHNVAALNNAGRVAYGTGEYAMASRWFALASKERPQTPQDKLDLAPLAALREKTERILELSLSKNLPAKERAEHILTASSIAKLRFQDCATRLGETGPLPGPLQSLKTQWQSAAELLERHSALENAEDQDSLTQLVFDTEIQTSQLCGSPTGDDALLLLLAKSSHENQ